MTKELGKIEKVKFGHCGYQDACLGQLYENNFISCSGGVEDDDLVKLIKYAKSIEEQQTGDWVETHWYEEIDGKKYKLYYDKNNEWK
jgi:hypothetical protein